MRFEYFLFPFLMVFVGNVLGAEETLDSSKVQNAMEVLRQNETVPESASLEELFSCLRQNGPQSLKNSQEVHAASRVVESERSDLLFQLALLYKSEFDRDLNYSRMVLARILERPDLTEEQSDEAIKLYAIRNLRYFYYETAVGDDSFCQYLFRDSEDEQTFSCFPEKYRPRIQQYMDWVQTQFYEDTMPHHALGEMMKNKLESAVANHVLDEETFWWAVDGFFRIPMPKGMLQTPSKCEIAQLAQQVQNLKQTAEFTEDVRSRTLEMLKLYSISIEWEGILGEEPAPDSSDERAAALIDQSIECFHSLKK